jgi:hypothetical protein
MNPGLFTALTVVFVPKHHFVTVVLNPANLIYNQRQIMIVDNGDMRVLVNTINSDASLVHHRYTMHIIWNVTTK